ncbi:MAG: response regulator [Candidatus Eisenbacteria bacterium]|uniref:histidine kinase n=1 Tax=Eiseniibacteriota bacterium TaxID=2212470 RepID=A0A948RRH9_UNCEI|nr:response regulator [Candidatus Eisenbacteria bacterium]MBU1948210.1 response regulator [Candidatus Eisenbacteria bacterium]MBU2689673.1 response regulator [Candidatus Eisenbacteria bacterium]
MQKDCKTILVVEDEPALRRFLELLLRKNGYDVAVASDGVEALARADEKKPDLVLLDLMMPKMDGFEVCQRLKSQSTTAKIPVFILTARTTAEARERCSAVGADEFIMKPYNPQDLMDRVEKRLNENQSQS